VVTNFESHFVEHCTEILRARALLPGGLTVLTGRSCASAKVISSLSRIGAAPQLVEKAAFFYLVQIAPVIKLLRLELLRSGIGRRDIVEDRLDGFQF
jgi:ABC-type transporter Mla maintaining outer membrane lipid asymmetry permease subunit MlaE